MDIKDTKVDTTDDEEERQSTHKSDLRLIYKF